MACIVHMLKSANFNAMALAQVQSASIDESGSPAEFITASSPNVQLVGVDRYFAPYALEAQRFEFGKKKAQRRRFRPFQVG